MGDERTYENVVPNLGEGNTNTDNQMDIPIRLEKDESGRVTKKISAPQLIGSDDIVAIISSDQKNPNNEKEYLPRYVVKMVREGKKIRYILEGFEYYDTEYTKSLGMKGPVIRKKRKR